MALLVGKSCLEWEKGLAIDDMDNFICYKDRVWQLID